MTKGEHLCAALFASAGRDGPAEQAAHFIALLDYVRTLEASTTPNDSVERTTWEGMASVTTGPFVETRFGDCRDGSKPGTAMVDYGDWIQRHKGKRVRVVLEDLGE